MPIFRVKSVKIYTGQKNLHWRRQWRQWQLSGMGAGDSWSPNSTVLHLDIHLFKYTDLKDTAGQSARWGRGNLGNAQKKSFFFCDIFLNTEVGDKNVVEVVADK